MQRARRIESGRFSAKLQSLPRRIADDASQQTTLMLVPDKGKLSANNKRTQTVALHNVQDLVTPTGVKFKRDPPFLVLCFAICDLGVCLIPYAVLCTLREHYASNIIKMKVSPVRAAL